MFYSDRVYHHAKNSKLLVTGCILHNSVEGHTKKLTTVVFFPHFIFTIIQTYTDKGFYYGRLLVNPESKLQLRVFHHHLGKLNRNFLNLIQMSPNYIVTSSTLKTNITKNPCPDAFLWCLNLTSKTFHRSPNDSKNVNFLNMIKTL